MRSARDRGPHCRVGAEPRRGARHRRGPAPRPIVANVAFRLDAGEALGIIGPSGSGKTSLVRGLVGAWLNKCALRETGPS